MPVKWSRYMEGQYDAYKGESKDGKYWEGKYNSEIFRLSRIYSTPRCVQCIQKSEPCMGNPCRHCQYTGSTCTFRSKDEMLRKRQYDQGILPRPTCRNRPVLMFMLNRAEHQWLFDKARKWREASYMQMKLREEFLLHHPAAYGTKAISHLHAIDFLRRDIDSISTRVNDHLTHIVRLANEGGPFEITDCPKDPELTKYSKCADPYLPYPHTVQLDRLNPRKREFPSLRAPLPKRKLADADMEMPAKKRQRRCLSLSRGTQSS